MNDVLTASPEGKQGVMVAEYVPTEIEKYCAKENIRIKQGAIVVPYDHYMILVETVAEAKDALTAMSRVVARIKCENEAIRPLRDKLVKYATEQGTLESGVLMLGDEEIVIPGFNGPRPEDAHFSRDTMADVLTHGASHKMRKKMHPVPGAYK